MNQAEGHTYLKHHSLQGDVSLVDLNKQAAEVLAEARQATSKRAARTLIKEGPLRLTLVAFPSGGTLSEHNAGGPVSIHVLTGAVEIGVGGSIQSLPAGQALVLRANQQHSLKATADSVVLLTIAM